jgi:hypothetical protein
MLDKWETTHENATPYTTVAEFCELFTEEMNSLYVLSFLLTADKDRADQCVVGGLEECVEGFGAFMESSRLSARRAVIRRAAGMVKPKPKDDDSWLSVSNKVTVLRTNLFAALVSLNAFERFVFVMIILEGQSDGECLRLLRCSLREVV